MTTLLDKFTAFYNEEGLTGGQRDRLLKLFADPTLLRCMGFNEDQIGWLEMAKDDNLNFTPYFNPAFSPDLMQELIHAQQCGLLFIPYCDPDFNSSQAKILRMCQMSDIPITPICDPSIPWEEMESYRLSHL